MRSFVCVRGGGRFDRVIERSGAVNNRDSRTMSKRPSVPNSSDMASNGVPRAAAVEAVLRGPRERWRLHCKPPAALPPERRGADGQFAARSPRAAERRRRPGGPAPGRCPLLARGAGNCPTIGWSQRAGEKTTATVAAAAAATAAAAIRGHFGSSQVSSPGGSSVSPNCQPPIADNEVNQTNKQAVMMRLHASNL